MVQVTHNSLASAIAKHSKKQAEEAGEKSASKLDKMNGMGSVVVILLGIMLMSMDTANKSMATNVEKLNMQRSDAYELAKASYAYSKDWSAPSSSSIGNDTTAAQAVQANKATIMQSAAQIATTNMTQTSSELSQQTQLAMAEYMTGLSALHLFKQYATTLPVR